MLSLYSNIPIDLAISGIMNRWEFIRKSTNIPREEFIGTVSLVLNSTYFTFNNTIYKQIFGSPMGSPLSSIIADIVLQDIESKVLNMIPVHILFYVRYVDDIVLASPPEFINQIEEIFNSFHRRLSFTVKRIMTLISLTLR